MELVLSIVLGGLAAFAFAVYVSSYVRVRLMLEGAGDDREDGLPLAIRIARALSERVSSRVLPGPLCLVEGWVGRRISAAGFDGDKFARGFSLLTISTSVVTAILMLLSSREGGVGSLAGGFALGGGLPLMWITRKARLRQELMVAQFPFVLDMLTLCVEAGCDLAQAMLRVSERMREGPLAQELCRVSGALRTGASRGQALSRLKHEGNPGSISRLAGLLIQADRMGTGVAPILRSASAKLASERFARAERMGAYASQKLLAPLILCIMPATFLIIFGPIVVRFALTGIDGILG